MEDIDTDNDGEIDIQAGEDWCFAYGEEDWVSGATTVDEDTGEDRRKVFSDYLDEALLSDQFKTKCG